jgi:hypothetical protein
MTHYWVDPKTGARVEIRKRAQVTPAKRRRGCLSHSGQLQLLPRERGVR